MHGIHSDSQPDEDEAGQPISLGPPGWDEFSAARERFMRTVTVAGLDGLAGAVARAALPGGRLAVILTGAVARYFDAWNDRDPVACGECFAPDGVREWRVLAPPHLEGAPFPRFVGRRAIAERIAAFMASVPDMELDISSLSAGSDDRIWTEWRVQGTHAIDLGHWAARGEPLDYLGVSIFRVGDQGIQEELVYWDTMLMIGSRREAAAYLS